MGDEMKRKTSLAGRIFMQKHIKRHIEKYGMSQKQAIAAAYNEARSKGYKVGKATVSEGIRRGKGLYSEYRRRKNEARLGLFD